jgi:hypothetical protein
MVDQINNILLNKNNCYEKHGIVLNIIHQIYISFYLASLNDKANNDDEE